MPPQRIELWTCLLAEDRSIRLSYGGKIILVPVAPRAQIYQATSTPNRDLEKPVTE
jgi:hypothetical protein